MEVLFFDGKPIELFTYISKHNDVFFVLNWTKLYTILSKKSSVLGGGLGNVVNLAKFSYNNEVYK